MKAKDLLWADDLLFLFVFPFCQPGSEGDACTTSNQIDPIQGAMGRKLLQ